VELVHDLRVASRRLNEALGLLRTVVGPELVAPHQDWLREVRDLVAPIRDADVMARITSDLGLGRSDRPFVAAGRSFIEHLKRQRGSHLTDARTRLSGGQAVEHRTALTAKLNELTHPGQGAEAIDKEMVRRLRDRIRRRRRRAVRLATKASRSPRPSRLHAARIAVKKLRYALELADEAGVLQADREIKVLHALQNGLGDLNDLDVLRERLKVFAEQARPSELPGIRALRRRALRRQKALVKSFVRDWPRTRRRLRRAKAGRPSGTDAPRPLA